MPNCKHCINSFNSTACTRFQIRGVYSEYIVYALGYFFSKCIILSYRFMKPVSPLAVGAL